MTLLSSIFRSQKKTSANSEKREISIRKFHTTPESTVVEELTMVDVLAERSRLLDDAHKTIASENEMLENMRLVASEEIASMQNAWKEEKIQLQQQAYDEGFQLGFEEGRDKALSDMKSSIQLANEVTEMSYENAAKYLVSQERVILELAMQSTKKIMGKALENDDGVFLTIVRRALKEAREMKEIKLYISADYFKLVSDNRMELAAIFPPDIPFLIFANDDFKSTECYIETNHGRIVVSIDEQLNELRKQLIEIMESGD